MRLFEREPALAVLGELAERLDHARGAVALVSGEAGIGKTALVDAFAASLRGERRVLIGACDALHTPQPLAPLFDVFRQLGTDAAHLLQGGRPRHELFQLLVDHLERATTVLVIEDVHWADDATLDLLKFLGRRAPRLPLLLVLTLREDEPRMRESLPFLTADIPRGAIARVRLEPLSEAAIAEMAAGRADAAALYRITGGNAFFVGELLAHADAGIPGSVRDVVTRRASALSPDARAALEVAAIIPSRANRSLLLQLGAADAGLDECLLAGLLRDENRVIGFRHEIARLAIAEAILPGRRRALHRAALDALACAEDPEPARLVHHALEAELPEAILLWAPRAAASAARLGAHREAIEHLHLALEHAGHSSANERAALLEKLSYELYLTDAIAPALDARREALAIRTRLGERVRQGDDLRWCSRLLWFLARKRESAEHAAGAIEILEAEPPGPELAMAWSNRAQLHMLAQEEDEAVAWGTRAIELARRIQNPEIEAHALNNVGTALAARSEEGLAMLERSLALALEHEYQEHAARAFTNLASVAVQSRRYDAAREALERGLDYAEQRDLDAWTLYMRGWRARLRLETADWAGAAADAARVLEDRRTSAVSRITPLVVLATIRARRGDPGAAVALDEARALAAGSEEIQRLIPVAIGTAELAWLDGDDDAARAAIDASNQFDLELAHPWERGLIHCWRVRLGAPAASDPKALPEPLALELRGDPAAAAAAWERLGCRADAALVLAFASDPEIVARALPIAQALGASALSERIRRRLRRMGARVPAGPRRAARANPAGLTARQMDVLRLLADGLRNQEIADRLHLTPKTVDHHVSAILGKLGVRSRLEASRAAFQLGLL